MNLISKLVNRGFSAQVKLMTCLIQKYLILQMKLHLKHDALFGMQSTASVIDLFAHFNSPNYFHADGLNKIIAVF